MGVPVRTLFGKGVIMDNQKENWRIVQKRMCVKAGLLFLGVMGMQVVGALLLTLMMTVTVFITGNDHNQLILQNAGKNGNTVAYALLLSSVCAILSGLWCAILYRKSDWRIKGLDYRKAFSGKNILSILGVAVGGYITFSVLLGGLEQLLPKLFENYGQTMDILGNDMWLTLLYVLLIGPVAEEFIFRGAIFDRFYLAFPFWVANILQALLFGLYHMNIIQGIYTFCLGILLGMIHQVTGTIWANILCHALFNGMSHLMQCIVALEIPFFVMPLLLTAGVTMLVTATWYLCKKCTRKEEKI